MAETWLSWCTKRPGPAWKQGYYLLPRRSLNQVEGDVKHSAEGSYAGLLNIIATSTRQASWHFSVAKDGRVSQHYPLESICWHAGKKGDLSNQTALIGNVTLVGIEHEGFAGQTLTPQQIDVTVRITQEVRARTFAGTRPPELAVNLWEHNWLSGTACPSNRIPWSTIMNKLKPAAPPPPPPPPPDVWNDIVTIPAKQVTLYVTTNLVALPGGATVKSLPKGTSLTVTGRYRSSHYLTKWSMDNRKANGFAISATVNPAPPPPPPPPPPTVWDDIKPIGMAPVTLYVDTDLVQLPSGTKVKTLPKGSVLEVGGQYKNSHYLTKWSMANKKANGFAISATINPEEADMPTLEEIRKMIREETDSKRLVVKLPGKPWVWHLDFDRGVLVHDINITAFLSTGSTFDDVIELDENNSDHKMIMDLPVEFPKGLADLMRWFK